MEIVAPTDWVVFLTVVGLRFLLPLLIPFYPLPAILACLLIDGVDQTIFQQFTRMRLDGYQGYDKALDVYYLSVAYISTFRNWTNSFAIRTGRFLYYYRLVGVVVFELLQWRPALLIFPNVFEYFFIWYEAVKLFWNPARLTRRTVLLAAAVIWIVIKLPQEYWIHVAQLDATDQIKLLLGGAPDSAWGPLIAHNLLLLLALLVTAGALLYLLLRILQIHLPRRDHPPVFRADSLTARPTAARLALGRRSWEERIVDRDLFEKSILIGFVTVIFSQILPDVSATPPAILAGVSLFVAANTVVSHVSVRRGTTITSGILHFLAVLVMNFALVLLVRLLTGVGESWFNAVFFITLLSLLVTLFDRFQRIYLARFPRASLHL